MRGDEGSSIKRRNTIAAAKRRNTLTADACDDDEEAEAQNPLPMMLDVISLAVVHACGPAGDVRKNEHIFRLLLSNLDFSHKGEPATNWRGELAELESKWQGGPLTDRAEVLAFLEARAYDVRDISLPLRRGDVDDLVSHLYRYLRRE